MIWTTLAKSNGMRSGRILIVAVAIQCVCIRGFSQEPTQAIAPKVQASAPRLTIETVQQRLAAVAALPDLDDAAREQLRGQYQKAVRDLTAAAESEKQQLVFVETKKGAAESLQRAAEELKAVRSDAAKTASVATPPNATLGAMEGLLKTAGEKLAEAKRLVERFKAEPGRRQLRRAEISARNKPLNDERQRLMAELATARGATDPQTLARTTWLQARIYALDAERKLYEQELAAYSATVELLPIQLELAERRASLAEKQVELWREKVEQRRTAKVRMQETSARLAAERASGALRPLAQRNRELAHESGLLVAKIQQVNDDLELSRQLLDTIQKQFKLTKEKVNRVGLNYAIGLLLRKEISSLPDVRQYKHKSRDREEIIRDVQLRLIDLAVERSTLMDVDYVESFIASMKSIPTGIASSEFEQEVGDLVEKRVELLATLRQNENAYFERLVDLDTTQRQLCTAVSEYENYIDERVLWIRSSEPIAWSDFSRSISAFRWFTDPAAWSSLLGSVVGVFSDQFLPFALLSFIWLILLFFQHAARLAITRLGEAAARGSCRGFRPTTLALGLTLLVTATWPALLLIVAWLLTRSAGDDGFARALSAGLVMASFHYGTQEFLRQVCRSKGLGDAHFSWPQGVRTVLRSKLRWLMVISIPLVFVAATLYADASSRSQDTLNLSMAQESAARLLTIVVLTAGLLFTHQVLRPSGPFYESLGTEARESRIYRWRRPTYSLSMFMLGLLLLLAVIGYDFTVVQLSHRMFESALLLEVLLVAIAMVNRWLVIGRRRMAIEQARQRQSQATGPSGTLASIAISENSPDLTAIGDQSRRLLQSILTILTLAGLWYIWTDVSPALSFLERFELWTVSDGPTAIRVTVNHVIIAGVILVATLLAARNIPGLLEIAVLSRLPLDAGNRYAITTICRYVLTIVGLILAFGALGIAWSRYQWLVAAVTVGLGFGLQEIFANFVSGLIVLFEQPIRVGDVVTIGDVTGVVSRIRVRATTVTNWEHQEFIVPNREFISGRLLNWTLSNTVNRVVINLGVAYGTDPDTVKRLLLKIAEDHPNVVADPAPSVTFAEFGDSTLNFVLRCYLPDLDNRLSTTHALNTAAQKTLNEAGIEFAFPTREVLLRPSE